MNEGVKQASKQKLTLSTLLRTGPNGTPNRYREMRHTEPGVWPAASCRNGEHREIYSRWAGKAGGPGRYPLPSYVLRGPPLSLHSYVPCSYLHLGTNEHRKLCPGFWRKAPSFVVESVASGSSGHVFSFYGHRKEFAERSLQPSAPAHLCWVPGGLNLTQAVQKVPVPVPDPEARLWCAENSARFHGGIPLRMTTVPSNVEGGLGDH